MPMVRARVRSPACPATTRSRASRPGGYLTAPEYSENEGIYRVSASGGAAQLVARDTSNPQFGASSDRVFMLGRKDGKLQLLSADLDGEARQVHAEGELATEYHVSPRGDFVAFRENYEVFATPLMPGGQAVTVGEKASSLPVVRASKGGADYIGWTQDGDMLTWTMGPVLYRASVASMFANAPKDKDAPKFVPPTSGTSLERVIAADKRHGCHHRRENPHYGGRGRRRNRQWHHRHHG